MGNCGNCADDCGQDCSSNCSGDKYIMGLSVFDRRENELTQDDVECEFEIGANVYNPNTREYGTVDGYKKMLNSLFVLFAITGINESKNDKLFSDANVGKRYYVEPIFIERDGKNE